MLDGQITPAMSSEVCSNLSGIQVDDYIMDHLRRTDEIRARNRAVAEKLARQGGLMPLDNTTGGPGDSPYGWMCRRGD